MTASASAPEGPPWWVPLAVSVVSAAAALIAAAIAARSAGRARGAEQETERLRRLDARVAERKYDVYKPMLELLRDMLDPKKAKDLDADETQASITDFSLWVGIFGSDDAVTAFRNFMQAAYHNAPHQIHLRLYAEFALASRRDMGDPDTAIDAVALLGIRIKDLHDTEDWERVATSELDDLFEEHGWKAPWEVGFRAY